MFVDDYGNPTSKHTGDVWVGRISIVAGIIIIGMLLTGVLG